MDAKSRTGGKRKKKEKEVTHSCVVRSLLCKAFMLQRKVLLREGEGDQNAGRQMSKHTAARTARGQTLQQRWQTQKLHSACFLNGGKHSFPATISLQVHTTSMLLEQNPHIAQATTRRSHKPPQDHTQSQRWDGRLDLLSYKN